MKSWESFYHSDEGRHRSGTSEDENVMLPLVLHDLLDLPQDGLDLLVVDGLGPEGLVELHGQFEEPGLVGTGNIFLVLEEPLI